MDKNLLEEKIERIFSEISEIPESQREDSAEFSSLKSNLTEKAWQWAEITFGKTKIQNAGVEIMKCVGLCISSFDSTCGKFICYLSASLKNEISRANEKNAVFEARCIKIPSKKITVAEMAVRYAMANQMHIGSQKTLEMIAQAFGIEYAKIEETVRLYFQDETISENSADEDDEDFSLFDTNSVNKNLLNRYQADKKILDDENLSEIEDYIAKIDRKIQEQQKRTQPYISALVTNQLLHELDNAHLACSDMDFLDGVSFISTKESREIVSQFMHGEPLSQENVAKMFGRDKTDASRTMRGFLEKLKKDL